MSHVGALPHAGGCEGCRKRLVCNVCGDQLHDSLGKKGDACTNGRCGACHGSTCVVIGPEVHGYGTPKARCIICKQVLAKSSVTFVDNADVSKGAAHLECANRQAARRDQ